MTKKKHKGHNIVGATNATNSGENKRLLLAKKLSIVSTDDTEMQNAAFIFCDIIMDQIDTLSSGGTITLKFVQLIGLTAEEQMDQLGQIFQGYLPDAAGDESLQFIHQIVSVSIPVELIETLQASVCGDEYEPACILSPKNILDEYF